MTALTVVAVHGNGGGAFRWDLMPSPMADDVTLHPCRLPGFEGRPLPTGPIDISTFTDSLASTLSAIDRPRVILGHGIGGAIGLDVAANRPELVEGLILHAPVAVNLDERLFPRIMSAPPVRAAAKWLISSKGMQLVAGQFLFKGAPRPYVRQFLAEYRRADAFAVMFDLLTAEWFDSLPPVAAPTAILWGENDRVLDVSQAADLEARLQSSTSMIVPAWGHYPMIEQPDSYAATIAEVSRTLVAP